MGYRLDSKFNVAQLLREPTGAARSYQLETSIELRQGEEVAFRGQVDFLRTDKGVLVHAQMESLVSEICSRCLSPFAHHLRVEFREEFYPTVEVNLGYRLPPPEDTISFTIDENHLLDIGEALRQYAIMALPLKPLCHSECAGLCPQCGKNLNEGPCGCPPSSPDPRWSALRDLEASNRG
ncbi:MAG: DUF177 domain-containing protein [Chloroflexi bacterium]|nr:DUF177 domain-containing protein [Chloroflexota bacterium]